MNDITFDCVSILTNDVCTPDMVLYNSFDLIMILIVACFFVFLATYFQVKYPPVKRD